MAILSNNCAENPLPDHLDKIALDKAKELKQKKKELKIGPNDMIETHIDGLDIYDGLTTKETEILKAHITNYYYCLKS